jgi:uncharacterized protein (DUF2147 family)
MNFDGDTGKPLSIVKISVIDGELRGRIEKILDPEVNPICVRCPEEKKNKPVVGLEFLGGFRPAGSSWSEGWILIPSWGRTYHANLEVLEGGNRLKVSAFVRAIVKIGRSQTWERVAPEEYGLTDAWAAAGSDPAGRE